MAKSKLLTAAALTSALVLASCGGNVQDDDSSANETVATTTDDTTEETTDLVLDTGEDEVVLDIIQVEPDEMIEVAVDDEMSEFADMTLVHFDFDKASIRAEFRDMLNWHAAYLVANPTMNIVLEGHADERGTREYNLGLGENRSKQVASYLQVKGVSAAQIDVVSYGEEKPLALGKSESEYSENRRVELVYK